jgi:hypothetical protein
VPLPVADTPPNAAFIDDPAVVSDKRLDSPAVFGFGKFIFYRLTFRQNFNFEASSEDPNLGFDGGVLELSTDGGKTFQYIPPYAFALGGYNRTISTDRGSPLAGLRAWSGNSEGFITTVVGISSPFFASGKVRWRMASDTSGSNEGWRIDTLNVTGCHGQGTPCPSPTPSATPTVRPTPTPRPRPTPAPRP